MPNNLNDNNSEDVNRKLAKKLAAKKNRSPEEEVVLRDCRKQIADSMDLEVDPHFEHLLYERTWRFSKGIPISNIKVGSTRTSASLAQAVWAANAGLSLEEFVASKTKVNRLDEVINHNGDYRFECLTLDSVNLAKQRMKVELLDVPKEFWGMSWDPETEKWYARVRVNKQNTYWESSQYDELEHALDVLRFAQDNKHELNHVNGQYDYLDSNDNEINLHVDIWSVLNKHDKTISREIAEGIWTSRGLEMPSEQVIINLKANSISAHGKKEFNDTSYIDTGEMPPIVVNEELRRNAPWNNMHNQWRRNELKAFKKLGPSWSDFINRCDDSHVWPDSQVEKLMAETERLNAQYYGRGSR